MYIFVNWTKSAENNHHCLIKNLINKQKSFVLLFCQKLYSFCLQLTFLYTKQVLHFMHFLFNKRRNKIKRINVEIKIFMYHVNVRAWIWTTVCTSKHCEIYALPLSKKFLTLLKQNFIQIPLMPFCLWT